MKKPIAITLLITYSVILFGYGFAFLGHRILHALNNPFHHHGETVEEHEHSSHEHEHPYDTKESNHHNFDDLIYKQSEHSAHLSTHHEEEEHEHEHSIRKSLSHDIDDHSIALGNLKENQNDLSGSEESQFLFTFVYYLPFPQQQEALIEPFIQRHNSFYQDLYQSQNFPPHTPPPLV